MKIRILLVTARKLFNSTFFIFRSLYSHQKKRKRKRKKWALPKHMPNIGRRNVSVHNFGNSPIDQLTQSALISVKIGKKHPDPVVETASLSSVEPSDVYYKISIPPEPINAGQLSALQLESITYASQAHDHLLADGSRAGFLVGDGAGVGKGRTIAGIIYENYLKGRKKSIWISVSNDLRYDAERDLRDIGASRINVYALNKVCVFVVNS